MKKWKVVYLRVSSDEQRENRTIESQRVEVLRYCKLHGIKIDKVYEDDGVSGTIPLHKRPYGGFLMADVAAGRIEEIYIWKIDRLGRNLRDFLNLWHKLERCGVFTEAIMQPVGKGPQGRAMRNMIAVWAELERENTLENTWRGLKSKAAQDGWTGGLVPFGYRKEGEKRSARLVEHEVNGGIVRRLFEMAAHEGKSCQDLANHLNALGIPTSRQNPGSFWRPNSVLIIIKNPIYTGVRQFARRQWIKVEDDLGNVTKHLKSTPDRIIQSKVPQLIDQELWDLANAQIKGHQILHMARPKTKYLLRGLIKCGIPGCGHTYTGRGTQYACNGRHCAKRLKINPPCAGPLIYRAEVEGTIWDLCEMYISKDGKAVKELQWEMESATASSARTDAYRVKLEERKRKNDTALETARRQEQDGLSTHEEFLKDMRRLLDIRSVIDSEIKEYDQKSQDRASRERDLKMVGSVLEKLKQKEYSDDDKLRIVKALVKSVTVLPNGQCRIDLKFHCEAPGWLHGVPETEDEVRAGVKGLRVALEATPRHSGSPDL
jgi:site-specific DNA recombinase